MGALLHVAQVIEDTEAEGPGRRFAVWVQGCPLRCAECCNPQMLRFEGGVATDPLALAARALAVPGLEGVSLLGGEPFAQAEACAAFARAVRAGGLGVMIYSGFTLAELQARPDARALLDACDLLVDGPYDRARPEPSRRWIGSANQERRFLTERYRPDDPCWTTPNTIEVRLRKGELVVNGWPALARSMQRGGA
ncbi:MAG: radical SAM protein [Labilithrix sp.]|nr:radical SAM protein [Labilithrix sp.]MCW5816594.1 radical SAM protein [Labilithrix sp.]